MKYKIMSRKLWLAIAAFVGSIGAGITGLVIGNTDLTIAGTICCVVSAAMYQASEAYIDAASAASKTTSTSVTASTTAKEVVQQALDTKAGQ